MLLTGHGDHRIRPRFRGASWRRPRTGSLLAAGALLLALGAAQSALAFYEFARGEFFLRTTGSVTYDSNVFGREEAEQDILFALNPELQYIRRAGRGNINAAIGVRFGRYSDFTAENFNDFYSNLTVGYPMPPGSRFGGSFTASYSQDNDINEFADERRRIRSTRYSFGLNNSYRLSPRVGLNNSLGFSRTETRRFSTVNTYSGSLGASYFYSENLSFSTNYGASFSESDGQATGTRREILNQSVTVGVNGQISPQVNGNASVGLRNTQTLRGEGRDRNSLIVATGLNWAARANTTVNLSISRDVDLSADDRTRESTSARLGVNQRLTAKMTGNASVGYRITEYRGVDSGTDHVYSAGAGLGYSFTTRWSAGLGYSYTRTDSHIRDDIFDRHTASLSSTYTF